MNQSRLSIPAAAAKQTPSSFWDPARLLLAGIGGIILIVICYVWFLDDSMNETSRFITFLQGQTGFEGFWESPLFWKMAIAFVVGACIGYFISFEIPSSKRAGANRIALGVALFLIPVITYIPAMSAGFIWDDDQEIQVNRSIIQWQNPDNGFQFETNWRGLWEIWTGSITNFKEADDVRLADGKKPAPFLVRVLRPPLCWIEWQIWGKHRKDYVYDANQFADYFPVKSTTLWLEYQLWGYQKDTMGRPTTWAPAYHTMTILFHALDGLLLWILLCRLKMPGAWLGALLFVIHPVHSESVAWIAERKNTLSLLFILLSLLSWLKFEELGKRRHYVWTVVLFVTALLCKTHVVVYPAVLMLMAWWQTGRIPVLTPTLETMKLQNKGEKASWKPVLRDLAVYVPLFAIALGMSMVTVWFQNDRAISSEVIPIGDWPSRIAGAGVVFWCYVCKVLLPMHLNTIYADTWYLWWPLTNPKTWMFLAGALIPMTMLFLLAVKELWPTGKPRLDRTPFFVFAYFFGTLVPILGFFTMSYMRLTLQADHFQYFSDIAVVAFAGAAIATLYNRLKPSLEISPNIKGKQFEPIEDSQKRLEGSQRTGNMGALAGSLATVGGDKGGEQVQLPVGGGMKVDWRPVLVAACVLLVFACCVYCWDRAGVHQSEVTLWEECLKKNWNSWQAHNHIGAQYYGQGRFDEAEPHFAEAVRLKPANPEVHNNLGLVWWRRGLRKEAIEQYEKAVEIKPEVIPLRMNLAGAYIETAQFDKAKEQFRGILRESPNEPQAHAALGAIAMQSRDFAEARKEVEAALKFDPNNPTARRVQDALRQEGKW